MKVVELREALKKRGLRTDGLKKDLVARLDAEDTCPACVHTADPVQTFSAKVPLQVVRS